MQEIPYDASHVPIDYDDPVDVSLRIHIAQQFHAERHYKN